jgi:hypothetical protein
LQEKSLIGQPSKASTLNASMMSRSTLPQVRQASGDMALMINAPLIATGMTSSVDANESEASGTVPKAVSEFSHARDYSKYLVQPRAEVSFTPSFVYLDRQVWEGTVVKRLEDSFVARVIDQTKPTNPEEQVTFSFDEVSADDLGLVTEGASFYWRIGTERSPAGQVKNVSLINFRRLPQWSNASMDRAERNAKELASILFRNDDV